MSIYKIGISAHVYPLIVPVRISCGARRDVRIGMNIQSMTDP